MAGKKNAKSLTNLKPFPPGQSGNPAGAPKGKRLRTVIREIMELPAIVLHDDPNKEILRVLEGKLGRPLTERDRIVFGQMKQAAENPKAAALIFDREEGRPAAETEDLQAGGTYVDFLDEIGVEDE